MIRPRKVVTRRQYERCIRQEQMVDSLCNGGGTTRLQPRPSSTTSQQRGIHQRRVEIPMPLSPLPSDDTKNADYERLEIYDGTDTPRPTSLKRRRTPSRVALYRQIDIELEEEDSSKDSSTYTDSLGHSNSDSAEMGHSVEDTVTLLSDQNSESFISEPTLIPPSKRKDQTNAIPCINNQQLPRADNNEGNEPLKRRNTTKSRKQNKIFYSPTNALSPNSADASILDVSETISDKKHSVGNTLTEKDFEVQFNCCDHFTSMFKKTMKKQIKRPGMSLSEERRLWRSVLEGDIWDNHYQYARANSGNDNKEVDEIEVVPIENDFKASGSVNYAESENIGILFVPTHQYDRNGQHHAMISSPNNNSIDLPWWKRDQWKFSPRIKDPGSESHVGAVSRARLSVQTKKISNRAEEKQRLYQQKTKPIKLQQKMMDVDTTTLAPRLSPIRFEISGSDYRPQTEASDDATVSMEKDTEFEEKLQFHPRNNNSTNEPPRPFHVYNAKLERRTGIDEHKTKSYGVNSDVAIMFPIPHFYSSSHKEQSAFHDPKSTPTIVETAETDTESILTDLSEMIRQVDGRQQEKIIINCEDASQEQNAADQYKNSAYAHPITIVAVESESSLQNSVTENIAPVIPRRNDNDCFTHDSKIQPDRIWETRQSTPPPLKTHVTATDSLKRDTVSSMNPARNKANRQHDTVTFCNPKPEVSVDYSKRNFDANNHRHDHPFNPVPVENDFWDHREETTFRGRQREDLIDLTNLQAQKFHPIQQKRSESPIRLYGDPPVLLHMDGSPIQNGTQKVHAVRRNRSKSPMRFYGDPPVPQHMDGSPIQHRSQMGSTSLFEKSEANVAGKRDGPLHVWDHDLSTLQDIFARRDDIADLIAASSPNAHLALPDGSKIIMLKPILNVFKMQNDRAESPTSPWRNEHSQSKNAVMRRQCVIDSTADVHHTKANSPKVSLQVRTVFSNGEKNLAANYGIDPDEVVSSPVVTVSIDDDSDIDDELRKLAISERLLRKELEEVQKRSAVRRWEIDETGVKVKTREKRSEAIALAYPTLNRLDSIESTSNDVTLTSSVIDLSCIDIELERENSLISPLPVASAYQHWKTNTNPSIDKAQREGRSISSGIARTQMRPCETEVYKNVNSPTSRDKEYGSSIMDTDCTRPPNIPMTLSGLSQSLWNLYGKNHSATKGDTASRCTESLGFHVPSLSKNNKTYSPNQLYGTHYTNSRTEHLQTFDNGVIYDVNTDVLIEREPSWGTIEKLYQLSMKSESYSSNWLPRAPDDNMDNFPEERDSVPPKLQAEGSSNETSNSNDVTDPLFLCIERAQSLTAHSGSPDFTTTTRSGSNSDRENLTDIDTLDVDTSGGITVSDQSIYGSLLQIGAGNDTDTDKNKCVLGVGINERPKDPISPRLQSLLVHRKQCEDNSTEKPSNVCLDNKEAKSHGIYAELVRRSRNKNVKPVERANRFSGQGQTDDSNNKESHMSPISSVVKRYARQSSPAKRLERLRELHREMNEKQKEIKEAEKQSLLTRRLSPARRRATKSLKRNAVGKQPNQVTSHSTTSHSEVDSNTNLVVQDYMPFTRSTETGVKKIKKDAEYRDLVSLASSTRSHSLVAALPPAAKARSAVSGKPGRSAHRDSDGRPSSPIEAQSAIFRFTVIKGSNGADPSTHENELDECAERGKDLMGKTEQVHRQGSFESNFDASTRGDGSFTEYSDYDDRSFNQSQSFMDETHGPALLAFVEDYILGQRLEILDTCETEDDVASSSSSSFGSETCFSQDGLVPKTSDCAKIEAPVRADSVNDSVATKKSRWDFLLNSLAAKRKDFSASIQAASLTQKKGNVLIPRPKLLGSIKAKTPFKETVTSEVGGSVTPFESLPFLTKHSSIEEASNGQIIQKSLEKLHRIRMESEKQLLTTNQNTDQIFAELNEENFESSDEQLVTFEVTDGEHMNNVLSDDDQPKIPLMLVQQSREVTSICNNPQPICTDMLNMTDGPGVHLSVHSEGVEIPNIPQLEIDSSTPIKVRADKFFLKGKGRTPRNERRAAFCTEKCDRNLSEAQTCEGKQLESNKKAANKPILCSRCRCALTDNSVCALLSNESFLTLTNIAIPEMTVEQDTSFSIDTAIVRTTSLDQIIDKPLDTSAANNEDVTTNIVTKASNIYQSLEDNAVMETLDPINESELCCEASEPTLHRVESTIQHDFSDKKEMMDSPATKIETTITAGSPCRKPNTPSVQIKFMDWTGNDVEIITDSPRKNRLLWIQGIMTNTKILPPVETETSTTITKNEDNSKVQENLIKVEEMLPSSAAVCNFEMTACKNEKKIEKSRYFGRGRTKFSSEEKNVLISPINMPTSVSEDVDDANSQENTECCMESSAISLSSRVLAEEVACDENYAYGAELQPLEPSNSHDDVIASTHEQATPQNCGKNEVIDSDAELQPSNPSTLDIHVNEEAFILERAMQQVHAEDKFVIGHSKARRHMTSPVTLYRFLDFNPCRNELIQDNSYDFMYDPIGVSVCQISQVDLQKSFRSDGKTVQASLMESKQLNVPPSPAKSFHQKPGSSLKKVLRRLSKPHKVAFRENLVEIYSKDSESKQVFPAHEEGRNETDTLKMDKQIDGIVGSGETKECNVTKIEGTNQKKNGSKLAAKDKLQALLTEKSKVKRSSVQSTEITRNGSSSKSLGSAAKVLAALKAEYVKRRMSNQNQQSPVNKTKVKKKRSEIQSKLRAVNAAIILQEFKKAKAAGKLDIGHENEIPTQEGSDGTIATSGTKQSQISSSSRLTIEEKKLAHRLLNDIQLLAMIENKRQSMGHVQSSLKSADIDKSVKLLKSIEASRKNRISMENDIELLSTIDQQVTILSDKSTKN